MAKRKKKAGDPTVAVVAMTIVAVMVLGFCMVLVAQDMGADADPPEMEIPEDPFLQIDHVFFELGEGSAVSDLEPITLEHSSSSTAFEDNHLSKYSFLPVRMEIVEIGIHQRPG